MQPEEPCKAWCSNGHGWVECPMNDACFSPWQEFTKVELEDLRYELDKRSGDSDKLLDFVLFFASQHRKKP